MDKDNEMQMLRLVAEAYNTTPEIIHRKITLAIADGQCSPDPQVRSLWASIPHSGSSLTPEEFVAYLAQTLPRPYEP